MFKKILLLFYSLVVISVLCLAKQRTTDEAFELASNFLRQLQQKSSAQKVTSSNTSTLSLSYTSHKKNGNASYYVFNKGNKAGFVIIAGNDKAKSILGYTDSGNFNYNTLPSNIKSWLAFYDKELNTLPDTTDTSTPVISTSLPLKSKTTTSSIYASSISPLLSSKWNQDTPYNNQCPVINSSANERAATGCIATAMAQVMKYYNWPIQGTGSNSYATSTLGLNVSANFGQTQYDWASMTNSYNSNSTASQENAVATLMFHCGVAVNMDYDQTSSAEPTNMALALKNYFGYDSNLQLYQRDFYTLNEWSDMLKTELNASRPILLSGSSNEGGHEFVCDGYDNNGLFHFNWGWGGNSNGYFQLSSLIPSDIGIGGNTEGFNSDQTALLGIQKPTNLSTSSYILDSDLPPTCNTTSVRQQTEVFTVTGNSIYNFGINTFNGYIGIALYNSSNTLVQILKSSFVSKLQSQYGWKTLSFSATINTTIADGNYKLYLVYKPTSSTSWQILRGKVGTPNYLDINVKTNHITISPPSASLANLSLHSLSVAGHIYQNEPARITANITNTGETYYSNIGIYLKSTVTNTIHQFIATNVINIAPGETKNLEFQGNITLPPGQYSLSVLYDPTNNYVTSTDYVQLGATQTISILATPTETSHLILMDTISFPDNTAVDKTNATLHAVIKNTSGFFSNKLIAFIFPLSGENSLAYIGYQPAIFDSNEQRTITFSGSIDDLTPGQYKIAIYYLNSSNSWVSIQPSGYSPINFTIADKANTSVKGVQIYSDWKSRVLNINSDLPIQRIAIFDLTGRTLFTLNSISQNELTIPINTFKAGTYILRTKTAKGVSAQKFIIN